LKRFGIGLLCGVAVYIVVALASYFLIEQFSSNRHDREPEAAMTSVLFFGPIGAVLAFVVGVVCSRRSVVAPPAER
jgi:uncharacterized BrkB/YihY/UPF0761 family membrane protein